MSTQPTTIVKGSWEDLLSQAETLSSRQNDDAIPLWRKLVDRLSAMPANRLEAGGGYLRKLLRQARYGLQGYLTQTERHAEAITLTRQIMQAARSVEERIYWEEHLTDLLLYAGQSEEAIAQLQAIIATSAADDIESVGQLALLYLNIKRLEEASQMILEVDRRINHQQSEHPDADFREDRAYLANLKVWLAVEHGLWDEAIAWYQHSMVLDDYYRPMYARLYTRLLYAEQNKLARSVLEKYETNPLVLLFNQGLIAYHEGKHPEAETLWQQAAALQPTEQQPIPLLEKVLTHYYLGDKQGEGLGLVLAHLKERQEVSWMFLFLAALGWLLRGEKVDAQSNLAMSQRFYRSLAKGHKLPYNTWFYCLDLLPAELRQPIEHYFEVSKD